MEEYLFLCLVKGEKMSKDYVKEIVAANAQVYYKRLVREKGVEVARKTLHALVDQLSTNGKKNPKTSSTQKFTPTKLKAFMEKAQLSRAEVAEKLGVTPQCVDFWLSGKHIPGKDNVDKIQAMMNSPVTEEATAKAAMGAQRDLAQRLRQYMIDKEKTQAEVAKALGCLQPQISQWSRGAAPIPERFKKKLEQLVS